jgi:hypothetical protein
MRAADRFGGLDELPTTTLVTYRGDAIGQQNILDKKVKFDRK